MSYTLANDYIATAFKKYAVALGETGEGDTASPMLSKEAVTYAFNAVARGETDPPPLYRADNGLLYFFPTPKTPHT